MESTLAFQELEHDFLHYMLQYGGIARKTSHDYVSRMSFFLPVLVASHIKPLNVSDNEQRPDPFNGFLQQPNLDKLPLLCIVLAFKKKGVSLVEGWLKPCTLKTKNIDCVSVIRQNIELIKILSENIMDNVILEKFYYSLLESDNHKAALSVRNMLNDLPVYMKDRIAGTLE